MIKNLDQYNLKINVYLKNGEKYLEKDITSRPLGEHEKIVSFWEGDVIRVYQLRDVEYFELYEDKN